MGSFTKAIGGLISTMRSYKPWMLCWRRSGRSQFLSSMNLGGTEKGFWLQFPAVNFLAVGLRRKGNRISFAGLMQEVLPDLQGTPAPWGRLLTYKEAAATSSGLGYRGTWLPTIKLLLAFGGKDRPVTLYLFIIS